MDQPIPAGAIPVNEFQASTQPLPQAPLSISEAPSMAGAIPVSEFESQEDAFGSPGQQAIAGLEGIAKGIAGPFAAAGERLMGVPAENIRGRAEANPWTHGVLEGASLVGSAFIPGGQASVLAKVGRGAEAMSGLAKVAEGASVAHRVGSLAIRNAAEMAVFQGGDEVAKQILQDPDATAQSAVANIGLAALVGGVLGGGAGASKELWSATVGPKLEKTLSGITDHLNGGGRLALPEDIDAAQKALGIEISPATRAGMSGDPKAAQVFNELREAQNKHIINDIQNIEKGASDSVMRSLGVDAADVMDYSAADLGHKMRSTFLDEYKAKYGPIADAFQRRDELASVLPVSDDAKLKLYGDLLERGMKEFGTDSPFYKHYHDYGNRMLAKNSIGELDKLTTELGQSARSMSTNNNEKRALNDIAGAIKDFKESQISGSGGAYAAEMTADRAATSKMYKDFAEMSNKLGNHLGIGDFRGAGGLMDKLVDKRSAEQILTAFSPKGDADILPFLQKNFPDTLKVVQENELKKLLKPAILSAKGDNPLNISKLASIVEKGLAGEKDYIRSVFSPEALEKISAADKLMNALPAMKSSGTAGWMTKMYKHMPASALAAVGWLTGHNPLSGYLAGTLAQYVGREVPDALRLAFLKFLGSDAPIQAKGFKAMAEMIGNTYKGVDIMDKAVKNVFKPAISVLSDTAVPSEKHLQKLDKMVAQNQTNPQTLADKMVGNSAVGYYMPNHQAAITKTSSNALSYLASIKPQPFKPGPLDRPIEPTSAEKARYNRALTIAQQPTTILQHVKDGTLLPSDVVDIKAMYPALYQGMVKQLTAEMIDKTSDESMVSYKTRVGLSMFIGQPLDSSMTPQSILTAQPKAADREKSQQQEQPTKRAPANMGKANKDYMTPNQASEQRKSSRP